MGKAAIFTFTPRIVARRQNYYSVDNMQGEFSVPNDRVKINQGHDGANAPELIVRRSNISRVVVGAYSGWEYCWVGSLLLY